MINVHIDCEAATLHYESQQIMKYDIRIRDCQVAYDSEASIGVYVSFFGNKIITRTTNGINLGNIIIKHDKTG
jgi:hypothetical protein